MEDADGGCKKEGEGTEDVEVRMKLASISS